MRLSTTRGRGLVLAALTALLAAAFASNAAASVTIGQLAPGSSPTATCGSSHDRASFSVTSGASYAVPGTGTLTSWSTNAAFGPDQTLAMKVFRKIADPDVYETVAKDRQPLTGDRLNTFPVNIPVKPGDLIGENAAGTAASTACTFTVSAADTYISHIGDIGVGDASGFDINSGSRINMIAVFVPSNSFGFGKASLNKKKGTAKLTLDLPNAGRIAISGKDVKSSSQSVAAGVATVKVKPRGDAKDKLDSSGKVKVTVKVAFTPSGGDAATASKKLKLKKS
jgi:hypothetical protein